MSELKPDAAADSIVRHRALVRVDRWIRSIHLYTGLFLVPWMMVYATSAMLLNHGPAIREWFDIQPPKQEIIRKVEFTPADTFPRDVDAQADAILAHLELEGAHRVLIGQSNAQQLRIMRLCATGNYIVTWNRVQKTVVVQKPAPFSLMRLINSLHIKGGYGQPYTAHILWAIVVDLVAISIVFWVVSGIYIWARRPKKRVLGGAILLGGIALFAALVIALCD